jgi:hypothetical protein
MRPIFFKAYGYVTLFVILPILMGLTSGGPYNAPSFREQLRTLIGLGAVTAIGVGLVHLQRWAAIYFSVPLFCYGAWLAITSIEPIPFPLNLGYMALGASLMLPLFVTILFWSQLTWGPSGFSRIGDALGIIRALLNPRRRPATSQSAAQFDSPEPLAWLTENLDFQHALESVSPIDVVYRFG